MSHYKKCVCYLHLRAVVLTKPWNDVGIWCKSLTIVGTLINLKNKNGSFCYDVGEVKSEKNKPTHGQARCHPMRADHGHPETSRCIVQPESLSFCSLKAMSDNSVLCALTVLFCVWPVSL